MKLRDFIQNISNANIIIKGRYDEDVKYLKQGYIYLGAGMIINFNDILNKEVKSYYKRQWNSFSKPDYIIELF